MPIHGFNIKGAFIRGAEFIDPSQVASANLIFWYKWKTGVTLATGVSQWNDQSGNGYHLVQSATARQPAYNSTSGQILFDGADDYLQYNAMPDDPSQCEYTFVTDKPVNGLGASILTRGRHETATDQDALQLRRTANGTIRKTIAVGTGAIVASVEVFTEGQQIVSSFAPGFLGVNGAEVPDYLANTTQGFGGGFPGRHLFGALVRNSGGVPAQPTAYSTLGLYEACFHDGKLSSLERSKLSTYFRQKIGF